MLTANFHSWLAACITGTVKTGVRFDGVSANVRYDMLTSTSYGIIKAMLAPYTGIETLACGVLFGNGTTPPRVTDYTMESVIPSVGVSITKPSGVSINDTDEFWEVSATYGIYTKTTDVTISEIGLFVNCGVNGSTSDKVLIDRTVLETPIVIPAGQSKQVTYSIRLNKPKQGGVP